MTHIAPPRGHGGDAAVAALRDMGVDVVFGIPASHVIEIYDALARTPSIRTVVGRNEQNCAYSADGYARRARRPGVTVVTGGPGLGNTVTGLQTAYADSSPVVVLSSDLEERCRQGGPWGIPHETFDSGALAAATGATVVRAEDSRSVSSAVRRTLVATGASGARGGTRFRPAVGLLSRSALSSVVPGPDGAGTAAPSSAVEEAPAGPDPELVRRAAQLLRDARSPVVLAGTGVHWSGAEGLLADFLAAAGIPCVTTAPGRCVLDDRHQYWAGVLGEDDARRRVENADVVLAVGTSLGETSTDSWQLRLPTTLVHVDADAQELGRSYQPLVAVHSDAAEFLAAMIEQFSAPGGTARPVAGRAEGALARPRPHPWVDALSSALPEGPCTVVGDVSTTLRWLTRSLHCGPGRRLLMPWNSMGMGWSYPAALGVQAAAPEDAVVAVMGDGGALFCVGELATAVENDLPVCLLVVNNHSYGVIAELQDALCGGRRFGVDLVTPDFTAVADAFGVRSWRATSPAELAAAVGSALATRRPSLVEAVVGPEAFADVPPGARATSSHDVQV